MIRINIKNIDGYICEERIRQENRRDDLFYCQ